MITKGRTFLIAWIALAACGGASQTAAPPVPPSPPAPAPAPPPVEPAAGAPCLTAVDALFAVTATKERPEIRARSSKVFVNRCETDRWSAEIRDCLVAVKTPDDADRCEGMLTPDQKRELGDELARELDAAGVKPQMESGRPKARPAPAPAPEAAGAKPAEAKPAAPTKPAAAPRAGAKKTAPASKAKAPGAGRAADPCEGGE